MYLAMTIINLLPSWLKQQDLNLNLSKFLVEKSIGPFLYKMLSFDLYMYMKATGNHIQHSMEYVFLFTLILYWGIVHLIAGTYLGIKGGNENEHLSKSN